jgi:hypothetical protein
MILFPPVLGLVSGFWSSPRLVGLGGCEEGWSDEHTRIAKRVSGVLGMLASLWATVMILESDVEAPLEDLV